MAPNAEVKTIATFELNGRQWLIRRPTKKIKDEIDLLYSKTFFKYMRQGVCTHAEVMKLIKEQGIWTEDNEKEREGLVRDVLATEDDVKMLKEKKDVQPKEIEAKCMELMELRQKLITLNMTVQGILSNTAEQKARDTVYMYYIYSSLYEVSKEKPFFNAFASFDTFMEYVDGLMALEDDELSEQQSLERKLITESMVYLIGWTSDVSVEEIRNPLELRILAEVKEAQKAKEAEKAEAATKPEPKSESENNEEGGVEDGQKQEGKSSKTKKAKPAAATPATEAEATNPTEEGEVTS